MAWFCAANTPIAVPVDERAQMAIFLAGVVDEGHLVALGQCAVDGGSVDIRFISKHFRQFITNQYQAFFAPYASGCHDAIWPHTVVI